MAAVSPLGGDDVETKSRDEMIDIDPASMFSARSGNGEKGYEDDGGDDASRESDGSSMASRGPMSSCRGVGDESASEIERW